ncbi:MAG: nitroreductase family deazaflavin-dependent oxidoreductase [Candidatus Heimdallarchaeota archaeon]|nr:nitroreductase family deazaflavin-dependent oxidoreductase [Candidatus Heimdallarchaeota archaeon]
MDKTVQTKGGEFPRRGSAEYGFLFGDAEKQKKVLKRWKRLNKYFTIPLYKSGIFPLFGFGKIFLLLFTKGRKTGKTRVTPLEYRRKDGEVYVVAGRGGKAHWFNNLTANPDDMKVKIGFRKFPARYELIEDVATKNQFFTWYVTKFPRDAKFLFGWDSKNDNPEMVDFTNFSKLIKLIKIKKRSEV